VSYRLEDFEEEAAGTFRWTTRHKRCGAVGLKLGMMPVWDAWGVRHPCTVLYLDSNIVLRVKRSDKPDGYDAVQIGAGEYKKKNVKGTIMGQLKALGLDDINYDVTEHPPYVIREFRVTPVEGKEVAPEPGTRIHARHFLAGQSVDVSAISKGKGFQGASVYIVYTLRIKVAFVFWTLLIFCTCLFVHFSRLLNTYRYSRWHETAQLQRYARLARYLPLPSSSRVHRTMSRSRSGIQGQENGGKDGCRTCHGAKFTYH